MARLPFTLTPEGQKPTAHCLVLTATRWACCEEKFKDCLLDVMLETGIRQVESQLEIGELPEIVEATIDHNSPAFAARILSLDGTVTLEVGFPAVNSCHC